MPVVEDSDQVLPLLRVGDEVETDEGSGVLTSVQFNTAQYNGRWELEPPQLIVELDSGQTIHTCLCSITLPRTKKGTRLLHQEFDRLWPPRTDAVPSDSNMLIPEGDEDEPVREGERDAEMRNEKSTQRYAALRYEDLELSGWLDSETQEFVTFVLRLLASLPGGDRAEDAGYEPLAPMGWQEVKMITELLEKIEHVDDVNQVISDILGDNEEDDEY